MSDLITRAAWRHPVAEVAASQDELVTAAQLRAAGVPSSTIAGRLRQPGGWCRVLPGVVLVSGGRPDADQRDRAAVLYGGQGSVLGGLAALRRHGVLPAAASAPVEVLVAHSRHVPSHGFAVVTRTRRMPDPVAVGGIPAAPAGRALADVIRAGAPDGRDDQRHARLLRQCLARGLADLGDLDDELSNGPRQGSAALRRVISRCRDDEPATVRDLLVQVVDRAGISDALWQPVVVGPGGEPIGSPLVWIEAAGVAVEVAQGDPHSVARQQRLVRAGATVFPVAVALLRSDPDGQAVELRRTVENARQSLRCRARALAR